MLTIDSEKRADINKLRSHRWFLMEYNGLADELDLMPTSIALFFLKFNILSVTLEQIAAARLKNVTSSGDLPTVGKLLKERQRTPKQTEFENKPTSPVSLVESNGVPSIKVVESSKKPSSLPSPSNKDFDPSPFNFGRSDVKKEVKGDVVYNQVIGVVPPPPLGISLF